MKKILLAIAGIIATILPALAADTQPQFPGGKEAMDKFISENLTYPAAAKDNGIEGVVNISFIVKADGSIGTIKIVRLIDPDLEQEAIRIVKTMPAWTPATAGGTPVDAPVEIPIAFELPQ